MATDDAKAGSESNDILEQTLKLIESRKTTIRTRIHDLRPLIPSRYFEKGAAVVGQSQLYLRLVAAHHTLSLYRSAVFSRNFRIVTPLGSISIKQLFDRAQGIVEYEVPIILFRYMHPNNRRLAMLEAMERLKHDEIVQHSGGLSGFFPDQIESHRSQRAPEILAELSAWMDAVVAASIEYDQPALSVVDQRN